MEISIDCIRINDNRREVNTQKVKELAESIAEIGLINPITVKHDGSLGKYLLIAGLHRLEAYKLLGKTSIIANAIAGNKLELELIEIDENLVRNELHFSDIDDLLKRKKEIYEEMYPETKAGQAQALSTNIKKGNVVETDSDLTQRPSFITDTSQKMGQSETIVKESIYRATNLIPEAKEVIKQEGITKTEATKLSRETPETQTKVIDIISKGKAKRVDEAKEKLDPIDEEYDRMVKEIEAKDKRIKKLMNLLNYTQFLGITEQHVQEYFEMFPDNHDSFVSDLGKLRNIIDDTLNFYNDLMKIRRVK